MDAAYLLVAHGSRDPRPQQAIARLSECLADRLERPVDWAMLEFAPVPLSDRVVEFAVQHPGTRLAIAPFFLSSGVHVCEDIPDQLASARDRYAQLADAPLALQTDCCQHAGAAIDFARAACDRMGRHDDIDAWIAIAHGSRRTGGNTETDALGERIRAALDRPCDLAYWSRDEDIDTAFRACIASGHRRIGILPHFLFPGRLTDAIAAQIASIAAEFPEVSPRILPTWSEDLEWVVRATADWLQTTNGVR